MSFGARRMSKVKKIERERRSLFSSSTLKLWKNFKHKYWRLIIKKCNSSSYHSFVKNYTIHHAVQTSYHQIFTLSSNCKDVVNLAEKMMGKADISSGDVNLPICFCKEDEPLVGMHSKGMYTILKHKHLNLSNPIQLVEVSYGWK